MGDHAAAIEADSLLPMGRLARRFLVVSGTEKATAAGLQAKLAVERLLWSGEGLWAIREHHAEHDGLTVLSRMATSVPPCLLKGWGAAAETASGSSGQNTDPLLCEWSAAELRRYAAGGVIDSYSRSQLRFRVVEDATTVKGAGSIAGMPQKTSPGPACPETTPEALQRSRQALATALGVVKNVSLVGGAMSTGWGRDGTTGRSVAARRVSGHLGGHRAQLRLCAEARSHLRTALRHDPGSLQARAAAAILGRVFCGGLQEYTSDLVPGCTPSYDDEDQSLAEAGVLLEEAEKEGALESLQAFLQRWPDSAAGWVALARAHSSGKNCLKDVEESVANSWRRAQQLSPGDSWVAKRHAAFYLNRDNIPKSSAILKEAVESGRLWRTEEQAESSYPPPLSEQKKPVLSSKETKSALHLLGDSDQSKAQYAIHVADQAVEDLRAEFWRARDMEGRFIASTAYHKSNGWSEYVSLAFESCDFVHSACRDFPVSCMLASSFEDMGLTVIRAGYSFVGHRTRTVAIERHHSEDFGRLRLVCPLAVPEGSSSKLQFAHRAGLTYAAGQCLLFDESMTHAMDFEAKGTETIRASAFFDILHPSLGKPAPVEALQEGVSPDAERPSYWLRRLRSLLLGSSGREAEVRRPLGARIVQAAALRPWVRIAYAAGVVHASVCHADGGRYFSGLLLEASKAPERVGASRAALFLGVSSYVEVLTAEHNVEPYLRAALQARFRDMLATDLAELQDIGNCIQRGCAGCKALELTGLCGPSTVRQDIGPQMWLRFLILVLRLPHQTPLPQDMEAAYTRR
eukprot:TRINITY_DN110915_c0_g1_i1.p1 TRINITY_DN110915_c0_g1~~TRINITY_DN110915_c0_g1_i1.p1  ORF type:complete len:908 (+),score=212.74 TRINITY_DN110915_c0_g1_i1:319-2724(+)